MRSTTDLPAVRTTGVRAVAKIVGEDPAQLVRWKNKGFNIYDLDELGPQLAHQRSARTPRLLHRLKDPVQKRRMKAQLSELLQTIQQ